MPALSCRDWDEICDWFYRDDDVGRLMVSDLVHSEEQHTAYMQKIMNEMIAGKTKPSDFFEGYLKLVRWP